MIFETYAGGEKTVQKKYNIDYFGYADNLEVKFKLNFDEERGSKIEKKIGLTLIGINVICEVPFYFICRKCYIISV